MSSLSIKLVLRFHRSWVLTLQRKAPNLPTVSHTACPNPLTSILRRATRLTGVDRPQKQLTRILDGAILDPQVSTSPAKEATWTR
jgi:hypothetical protein